MDLQDLRTKLAKVEAEIADMGTTYSQSNPSYVLGLRSLRRQKERLEEAIREAIRNAKTAMSKSGDS